MRYVFNGSPGRDPWDRQGRIMRLDPNRYYCPVCKCPWPRLAEPRLRDLLLGCTRKCKLTSLLIDTLVLSIIVVMLIILRVS